jgi:hypothetical protein
MNIQRARRALYRGDLVQARILASRVLETRQRWWTGEFALGQRNDALRWRRNETRVAGAGRRPGGRHNAPFCGPTLSVVRMHDDVPRSGRRGRASLAAPVDQRPGIQSRPFGVSYALAGGTQP